MPRLTLPRIWLARAYAALCAVADAAFAPPRRADEALAAARAKARHARRQRRLARRVVRADLLYS